MYLPLEARLFITSITIIIIRVLRVLLLLLLIAKFYLISRMFFFLVKKGGKRVVLVHRVRAGTGFLYRGSLTLKRWCSWLIDCVFVCFCPCRCVGLVFFFYLKKFNICLFCNLWAFFSVCLLLFSYSRRFLSSVTLLWLASSIINCMAEEREQWLELLFIVLFQILLFSCLFVCMRGFERSLFPTTNTGAVWWCKLHLIAANVKYRTCYNFTDGAAIYICQIHYWLYSWHIDGR